MTKSITAAAAASAGAVSFTFGEPEAVLDRRELFDMFETTHNGRWYEPPVPFTALARTYRMASHHQSAVLLKRNLLESSFVPSRWLSRGDFAKWALDWILMGNAYLEAVPNLNGRPAMLTPSPAVYTRVGLKADQFFFVRPSLGMSEAHEFKAGSVHHMLEPDPLQEIYGLPEYLSALQSGLLNEAATIFRRRYYKNGSHAGFIMYVSEEGLSTVDSDKIREALKGAKGPGNFRNLYLHIPKGKKDGVQLLPIGEVAAKEDFLNIKDMTSQDLLVAHRTPPVLIGMVPKNTGGFGNVIDAARTFYGMEIVPIQQRMLAVNDWLGVPAVAFAEPDWMKAPATAPATNSPAR